MEHYKTSIAKTSNAIRAHIHLFYGVFSIILIDELLVIIADSSERAIRVLYNYRVLYVHISSIYIHFKYSDIQMHTTTEQKKIMAPGSQKKQPPRCCCHHTSIQLYAYVPIIFPILLNHSLLFLHKSIPYTNSSRIIYWKIIQQIHASKTQATRTYREHTATHTHIRSAQKRKYWKE